MTTKVTLYGLGPSRSFRVLWALEEIAIDYQYVELDFMGSGDNGRLGKQYLALNTQAKVPTLVDGELVLTESAAIINYLASKATDRQLKPVDGTALRAKYDEMCFFLLCELEQPLWTAGKHKFALAEEYRVPEILTKTVAHEFDKAQTALLLLLEERQFAVGDSFTMADIILTHTISWAQKFEFDVEAKLLKYRDSMIERPAYARAKQKIARD